MTFGTVIVWLLAILMMVLIGMLLSKKRWYLVSTATPEKLLLSRSLMEWEVSGAMVFRDAEKRKVIIPKRWILKIVEVKPVDLAGVKAELNDAEEP